MLDFQYYVYYYISFHLLPLIGELIIKKRPEQNMKRLQLKAMKILRSQTVVYTSIQNGHLWVPVLIDWWIAIVVVREYAKLNVLTVSDMLQ